MRRKRRDWALLACLGLVLVSSVAPAQTCTTQACAFVAGVPYLIPSGSAIAPLDGRIGTEWSGAFGKPTGGWADGRRLSMDVYLIHDGENLYLGVRVESKERYADLLRITLHFGNVDADTHSPGNNLILLTEDRGESAPSSVDYHYEAYNAPARDPSQDAVGLGRWDPYGRAYEFEAKVRLASGDPADFAIQAGVPFTLVIRLTTVNRNGEVTSEVNTPSLLFTI